MIHDTSFAAFSNCFKKEQLVTEICVGTTTNRAKRILAQFVLQYRYLAYVPKK